MHFTIPYDKNYTILNSLYNLAVWSDLGMLYFEQKSANPIKWHSKTDFDVVM